MRSVIYWQLDTSTESLYEWLERHKETLVTFSVTRFLGKNPAIASAAMGIIQVD